MNRDQIIDFVNEQIEEENGNPITEEQKLIDSGVDSFGLTMVIVNIDQKYDVYPKEEFKKLKFDEMTLKKVVDDVMRMHGSN